MGSVLVHKMERCGRGGAPLLSASSNLGSSGGISGACGPGEDASRPAVLIAVIAISNDSFGLVPGNGTFGKGRRGLEGFLGMLAEQASAWGCGLGLMAADDGSVAWIGDCHWMLQLQPPKHTANRLVPLALPPPLKQSYPACRTSLGLLFSSEGFFPAAVEAAARFVKQRGMARLVVVNKREAEDVEDDQARRHSGAWLMRVAVRAESALQKSAVGLR